MLAIKTSGEIAAARTTSLTYSRTSIRKAALKSITIMEVSVKILTTSEGMVVPREMYSNFEAEYKSAIFCKTNYNILIN